jgi:P27 family predicted phage terminase small subunit
MTSPIPRPPKHLRPGGAALWRDICRGFDLAEHDLHILAAACEAADRAREARERVDLDGAIVDGRYGPRAHPAIAIERDSRLAMLRALRELGLNLEAVAAPRPPTRWRGK